MPRHYMSTRMRELPESQFDEIIKRAAEDKTIISLGPGEPDYAPPKKVVAETGRAAKNGFTHYSPPQGRTDLREAIAKKLKKENKIRLHDSDAQVMVSTGSTEALILCTMAMVDPGEEMLVPDPGFVVYKPSVELMAGFARPYALKPENGFQVNVDDLKKKVTRRTHAIVINTPSNPTGGVESKKNLEEIADFAVEHDLMILSDEAYEHFVYGKKHVSIGSFNGMADHVVTFHSFSKTYAMAGYRLGYCAGPKWLIDAMTQSHIYTTVSPNTISQRCGLAALKTPKSQINKMRDDYDKRRKVMLKGISEIGYLHVERDPEGAFYAFPRITNGWDGRKLAKKLLDDAHVLTVPGIEFGQNGERFIRMSYATALPKIRTALSRMQELKG